MMNKFHFIGQLQLYDGTRLLGNDRYEVARQKYGGISDEEMTKKKILKIKDNFRIGMISQKKSLISIFGHNFTEYEIKTFIKKFYFYSSCTRRTTNDWRLFQRSMVDL